MRPDEGDSDDAKLTFVFEAKWDVSSCVNRIKKGLPLLEFDS